MPLDCYHLAADITGCGTPSPGLVVAGVQGKGDTDDLTIPASDLGAGRGPSEVRSNRDDLSFVHSSWKLSGVALQQQSGALPAVLLASAELQCGDRRVSVAHRPGGASVTECGASDCQTRTRVPIARMVLKVGNRSGFASHHARDRISATPMATLDNVMWTRPIHPGALLGSTGSRRRTSRVIEAISASLRFTVIGSYSGYVRI
jgi:hypothetical protein